MHKVHIAEDILARARRQRGGRDHIFDSLDLSRTAHVIVDLQVGFMAEGAPVEVPVAREIVDNVNAISRALRAGGGTNAFLRFTFDPAEPQFWSSAYGFYSPDTSMVKEAFSLGQPNWQLWNGLDRAESDLVVNKTRYSGFIPGTSELDALLRARGIDTLIITGTLTNCCCESTARDAMQMGYKIIFVSDGNAAITDAEHNGTLASMAAIFADVMDTEHLVQLIEKSAAAPLALAS